MSYYCFLLSHATRLCHVILLFLAYLMPQDNVTQPYKRTRNFQRVTLDHEFPCNGLFRISPWGGRYEYFAKVSVLYMLKKEKQNMAKCFFCAVPRCPRCPFLAIRPCCPEKLLAPFYVYFSWKVPPPPPNKKFWTVPKVLGMVSMGSNYSNTTKRQSNF